MNQHIAALALGTLAALSPTAVAGEGWHDDFDEAVKVARKEGKDLFVDFTGSDWCGWCIKLHEEVFDFEEWSEAVKKDYVLVALDFPRSEEVIAKVPNPERNAALRDKYGVRGYPTILMMTVDGEVYAKTGYQKGGPEAYLEHMKEIRTTGRPKLMEIKKIVADFDAAKGKAKLTAWDAVVAAFGELGEDSPFRRVLADPVRWAIKEDADNERGLKKRATLTLLEAGLTDDLVIASCHELDPRNEEGLIEKAVDAQFGNVADNTTAKAAVEALEQLNPLGFKDQQVGFMLNFSAARWLMGPLKPAEPTEPEKPAEMDEAAAKAYETALRDYEEALEKYPEALKTSQEAAKKYASTAKQIGTEEERLVEMLDKMLEELG